MRILIAVLALVAAAPAPADVYKWVDREGKVHYGDTPPPNSAAKPVDVRKEPVVSGQPEKAPPQEQAPVERAPVEKAPGEPGGPAASPAAAVPQPEPPASARGMPFDVYIMLRPGMSEGELLQRAGPPDHESNDGTVGSAVTTGRRRNRVQSFNNLEIRKFYYYPTLSDPFTTVITLTGGMISDLQRTRKF
jgi:hypothetical protein